jgi:hypothetical protein
MDVHWPILAWWILFAPLVGQPRKVDAVSCGIKKIEQRSPNCSMSCGGPGLRIGASSMNTLGGSTALSSGRI